MADRNKGEADASSQGPGSYERILLSARREFLDRGFQKASLRSIAASADVTTGAIYGYFSSKSELFDALVADCANGLMELIVSANEEFQGRAPEDKDFASMREFGGEAYPEVVAYIHAHLDEMRLLLRCSSGTSWDSFMNRCVDLEVESTLAYVASMRESGVDFVELDEDVIRSLSDFSVRSMLESALECEGEQEALARIALFADFFHAGYERILTGKRLI